MASDKPKPKPPIRQLEFKQEIADAICERLALGESLRSICSDEALPAQSTIFKWLANIEAFAEQYARARETQADAIFDEILNIADDGRNDWMERNGEDDKGWRENGEALRRSQLRIDARKWMAGKLRPKKYGEKTVVSGDPDNPIRVETVRREIVRPNNSNG